MFIFFHNSKKEIDSKR